jgi:hypothetical protein
MYSVEGALEVSFFNCVNPGHVKLSGLVQGDRILKTKKRNTFTSDV